MRDVLGNPEPGRTPQDDDRDMRERLIRLIEPNIRRGNFVGARGYLAALETLYRKLEPEA